MHSVQNPDSTVLRRDRGMDMNKEATMAFWALEYGMQEWVVGTIVGVLLRTIAGIQGSCT